MGNHRAPRRADATPGASVPAQTTTRAAGGKRKATKHSGARGPLFKRLPSVPMLVGVAALAVSASGAVVMGNSEMVSGAQAPQADLHRASALSGTSEVSNSDALKERRDAVSRDSRRDAIRDASDDELEEAAEEQARERNAELQKLASKAEKQADKIALNLWEFPVNPVILTATFGQSSGLWANTHTGLDFNGNTGDPVSSVTNGTVTSVGSAGSYGNRVIVTTDEGEELWYCHLNSFGVSEGDTVRTGDFIGEMGATGNVTGSHLHLEVRPGGGDPVDPKAALIEHGLVF